MDVEQRAMPPLPMPRGYLFLRNIGGISQVNGYTEKQMTEYAMAAIAALTPPEGYVLVPVEPTEAMLDAVEGACVGGQKSPRHRTSRLRYKAMLSARPEVKP